nr:immunoglobulin heavy chain junction region [Macaca mulatta]
CAQVANGSILYW